MEGAERRKGKKRGCAHAHVMTGGEGRGYTMHAGVFVYCEQSSCRATKASEAADVSDAAATSADDVLRSRRRRRIIRLAAGGQ